MTASSLPDPSECLGVARTLAKQAGEAIKAYQQTALSKSLSIDSKSSSIDLVTSADHESQRLIFTGITSAYPSHLLIGEEEEEHSELTDAPTWIVDAIDGTTNYVHGISDVAISIAYTVGRQVLMGVVYNPFKNELFHAVRGHGAYLNDLPLRVSECPALQCALIISEWGYDRSPEGMVKILDANRRLLVANVRAVRQLGSGSLDMCYVAMGRADAVYTGVANESWKIWDYAAASLVAEESGASLKTLCNEPFCITSSSMVCAVPGIIDELINVVMGKTS